MNVSATKCRSQNLHKELNVLVILGGGGCGPLGLAAQPAEPASAAQAVEIPYLKAQVDGS